MGKRERLAAVIAGTCEWLSARSLRARLLTDAVAERLFLNAHVWRPTGRPRFPPEQLATRTDEFNRAAERYFAERDDPAALLGKPYTDTVHFARYLFDVGVLAYWLRLSPGEVVAELGAGTCWLSHFLNRFGCPTICIDVSPTALRLGRALLERDNLTNWDLEPQFLPYDGHRLPLADGQVDKMVLYDAFHHIPNQAEILREMARVLKDGGVAAMCEPSGAHNATATSRMETDEWGVLENDVVVEDLEKLALDCGFDRVSIVPLALPPAIEIAPSSIRDFLRGQGPSPPLERLVPRFGAPSYILLYKGRYLPTTRQPQVARAAIKPRPDHLEVGVGERPALSVRLANTGDTRWLSAIPDQPGWTRLGAHLHADALGTRVIDYDWYRGALPRDLLPGDEVTLQVKLPALDEPGTYRAVLDVVAERVLWFAHRDSLTAEVRIDVRPPRAAAAQVAQDQD